MSTMTIPNGELWEISAPCAMELHIGGNRMGNLSQRSGTLKVRGANPHTVIKSQEEIVYRIIETEDEYAVRKTPVNRKRDRR